jgi:hypothetical protein
LEVKIENKCKATRQIKAKRVLEDLDRETNHFQRGEGQKYGLWNEI